jgi:ParB-like chromosome segregation protein Spo0J
MGWTGCAGNHRYEAARSLGWTEIDAVISDFDDLDAELMMIDENLCRAELSAADRARYAARRRAIYLESTRRRSAVWPAQKQSTVQTKRFRLQRRPLRR